MECLSNRNLSCFNIIHCSLPTEINFLCQGIGVVSALSVSSQQHTCLLSLEYITPDSTSDIVTNSTSDIPLACNLWNKIVLIKYVAFHSVLISIHTLTYVHRKNNLHDVQLAHETQPLWAKRISTSLFVSIAMHTRCAMHAMHAMIARLRIVSKHHATRIFVHCCHFFVEV